MSDFITNIGTADGIYIYIYTNIGTADGIYIYTYIYMPSAVPILVMKSDMFPMSFYKFNNRYKMLLLRLDARAWLNDAYSDAMTWKHFPYCWLFVRVIPTPSVVPLRKCQWCIFFLKNQSRYPSFGAPWRSCDVNVAGLTPKPTRQNSVENVGNMPPLPPRHLLPHVFRIMPRNPNVTSFSQRGIIMRKIHRALPKWPETQNLTRFTKSK